MSLLIIMPIIKFIQRYGYPSWHYPGEYYVMAQTGISINFLLLGPCSCGITDKFRSSSPFESSCLVSCAIVCDRMRPLLANATESHIQLQGICRVLIWNQIYVNERLKITCRFGYMKAKSLVCDCVLVMNQQILNSSLESTANGSSQTSNLNRPPM